jgi:hypothetical protein
MTAQVGGQSQDVENKEKYYDELRIIMSLRILVSRMNEK